MCIACLSGKLDGLTQLYLDGVPDTVAAGDLSTVSNLNNDEWIRLEAEFAWRITRVEAKGFTVDEVRVALHHMGSCCVDACQAVGPRRCQQAQIQPLP